MKSIKNLRHSLNYYRRELLDIESAIDLLWKDRPKYRHSIEYLEINATHKRTMIENLKTQIKELEDFTA